MHYNSNIIIFLLLVKYFQQILQFIQKYHKKLAPKFRRYLKLQAHIYVAADVLQSKKT